MKRLCLCLSMLAVMMFGGMPAQAVVIYDAGVAPAAVGLTFGDHLVAPQSTTSVAGVGGSGISNAGDALNGQRTYTFCLPSNTIPTRSCAEIIRA